MIKFNEVTWYSKLSAIILFLLLLPILTFYIGTEYEKTQEVLNKVVKVVEFPIRYATTTTPTLSTYQNILYGWSLKYPSSWHILETLDGTGVSIFSDISANTKSIQTLKFSTIKKNEFEPISTKIGNVYFDLEQDALVDSLSEPERCLPLRSFIGKASDIPYFVYGGSTMSDPAYSDDAIITNQDYIITLYSNYFDEAQRKTRNSVYNSFTLNHTVKAVIPECVR